MPGKTGKSKKKNQGSGESGQGFVNEPVAGHDARRRIAGQKFAHSLKTHLSYFVPDEAEQSPILRRSGTTTPATGSAQPAAEATGIAGALHRPKASGSSCGPGLVGNVSLAPQK
jgi:hypothetical protein